MRHMTPATCPRPPAHGRQVPSAGAPSHPQLRQRRRRGSAPGRPARVRGGAVRQGQPRHAAEDGTAGMPVLSSCTERFKAGAVHLYIVCGCNAYSLPQALWLAVRCLRAISPCLLALTAFLSLCRCPAAGPTAGVAAWQGAAHAAGGACGVGSANYSTLHSAQQLFARRHVFKRYWFSRRR